MDMRISELHSGADSQIEPVEPFLNERTVKLSTNYYVEYKLNILSRYNFIKVFTATAAAMSWVSPNET